MKGSSLDLHLSPVTSTLQSCRREFTDIRSKEMNAVYRGRLHEYDLVEIQIRTIIEMASKEGTEVTAVKLAPVRLGLPLGITVKRSVKRFLEKRKKKRSKSVTLTPHTSTSSSSSSPHYF